LRRWWLIAVLGAAAVGTFTATVSACLSDRHDAAAEFRQIKQAYAMIGTEDPRTSELDQLMAKVTFHAPERYSF
ncbi:hypothetical protein ABTN53_19655, partial [Acinetobacter baumannii]